MADDELVQSGEAKQVSGLTIRYTVMDDQAPMRKWFDEPGILRQYPCLEVPEIDDTVKRWISFCRYRASLTAVMDGQVVGVATLYLWPYRKLIHQCQLGIIVDHNFRGKGIGTQLMLKLRDIAKENFRLELLHLEVYYENPAFNLYKRLGFKEFGRQDRWIKEPDGTYVGRIFMEKDLGGE